MKIFYLWFGMAIALSLTTPAQADDPQPITSEPFAEQPPDPQVLETCLAGQVTSLPNPYTDVPVDHWAYEAVLTLYYCGPIRPGLPPHVIDALTDRTDVKQSPVF